MTDEAKAVDAEEIRDLIRRGVAVALPNIFFAQRDAIARAVMQEFAESAKHKIMTIRHSQRRPFAFDDDQ